MATGTVLPTNTGTGIITNTAVTVTGGRSGHRGRRDVPFELHLDPVTSMEALAASVLKSIDAMVNEHECLQKVFCDGSKEAKVIGSGFQYMMPAYRWDNYWNQIEFRLWNKVIECECLIINFVVFFL